MDFVKQTLFGAGLGAAGALFFALATYLFGSSCNYCDPWVAGPLGAAIGAVALRNIGRYDPD